MSIINKYIYIYIHGHVDTKYNQKQLFANMRCQVFVQERPPYSHAKIDHPEYTPANKLINYNINTVQHTLVLKR